MSELDRARDKTRREFAGRNGAAPGPQPAATPKAPAAAVREISPYSPFPVETLPAPIGEYVRQAALALGCDPSFVAPHVLAVAASAIGNTRVIQLKPGWDEPCIVWSAVIADSGTLKSPAYRKAVAHLYRVQRRLRGAFMPADGAETDQPAESPAPRRVMCSDTTIEKLAELLEDNPRGILVARDELAGWLASFARYKGKAGGTDLPNWLEMWQAGTVMVDRKTGERRTLFIPRAAASVAGGIQPGVLAHALTPELLDAGLAARLLLAMPPKLPKHWSEAVVAPDVEAAYNEALNKLLALDFYVQDGEKVPHVLHLSPDAKAAWVAFYDKWAKEQAAAEGELAAAFSKLEAYAARFTMLHHVVSRVARREDDLAPIERESVEAGVILCRWFAAEARRVYSTLSETPEDRDRRRLVEYVRLRGGRITARLLQHSNSRKYPSSDAAEQALDALAKGGLADWTDQPATQNGGRPTRVLVLHPTPETTDTTDATSGESYDDGDDPPRTPTDTTADTTPPAPTISQETGGCVGSVGCRTEEAGATGTAGTGAGGRGLCRTGRDYIGRLCRTPGFTTSAATGPAEGAPVTAAVELLARCRAAGVEVGAGAGDRLLWEAAAEPPADLLADLAANMAAVLALVRGPHGNCDQCGRALDAKRRCWRCCDRPCADCGRPTGSAFIARCVPCGHRFNGNKGEPL